MFLEVHQLEKAFGDFKAVQGASFGLARGQVLSLLGPSGCGKTTTLRMIAGFEQPSAGRILVGGRDLTGLPARRRNVGMVFQSYALFPHMTAAENVGFGLDMRRVGRAERDNRVKRALDMVRMNGFEDRYPRKLSGGQQQRVALARALVIEPDLLLLDEPLSALDLKLREEMRDEIHRIVRELNITTLFVTHDQGEALVLSDLVAVMNEGRIEQLGSPLDVYRRPRTAFVAGFIGGANILAGKPVEACPGAFETELGVLLQIPGSRPPIRAVAVRAEDLRIHPVPGEAGVAAQITRARFLGDTIEYTLMSETGVRLTARTDARTSFAEGARVGVVIEPSSVVPLEPESDKAAA